MSDKYVNPLSAAKLVALVKSALSGKLDKSGGTITGDLEINGDMHASGAVQSDLLLSAPSVAVHNDAEEASVFINCSGDNAARITSLSSDGKSHYSRFAVGTPTGDNDAATKAYVDERLADAAYYDVYVQLADTQLEDAAVESGCYVIDCTASHTYAEIKAAADAGRVPRAIIVDDVTNPGTDGIVCPLARAEDGTYTFDAPNTIGVGGRAVITISHVTNDYVFYACGAGELPAVKSADNGKYLGVSGGAFKLLTPPASGGSITVDAALSDTSENPVQNKTVKAALDGKASTAAATTSAAGLMSAADKAKLDGIASGATKVTVDSAMSASSTNPVQNKAIKAAIDAKADKTALDNKLDKTGGTLAGNLTGKYITGTWLQTTAASDLGRTPGKIAVLDDSGWVYYRTPAELLADLGADYIESQGTTGVWTWRKWHSGIAEMWGIFEATSLAVNNAWGSVYYGTWMSSTANKNGRKYPFAFTDTPVVTATPYSPSTDFWLLTDSQNNLGTALTHAPAYACVLPGSATITNPRIHYYVVGKYK